MAAERENLRLIHYWHEMDAPDYVAEALRSLKQRNRPVEQTVFDRESAGKFIARNYGERYAQAFYACAVPAMQADYFRYCAVNALGGIYADANFTCVRGLASLVESREGVLFGRQDPLPAFHAAFYGWPEAVSPYRVITNSMFFFGQAGHPLVELAVEAATANIESRAVDGPAGIWAASGPGVFSAIYLLHRLGSFDRFIDYSSDSIIGPVASLFCEVVGDYSRIPAMWSGVDIIPLRRRSEWVTKAGRPQTRQRWLQFTGSIYI